MEPRTSRIGLTLFFIYLLLYGGFVLLSAFWPTAMEAKPIAGVNVAILYGFGLIIAAFVLALLYGFVGPAQPAGTGSATDNRGPNSSGAPERIPAGIAGPTPVPSGPTPVPSGPTPVPSGPTEDNA